LTSLPALLLERAGERPDAVALRHKQRGRWREWSWAEYAERAARTGLGLRALGVRPGDRVGIHSENRPAWLLADLGAQGVGAISVGVYPTSPAAEVEYVLGHCGARVLVCEDEEQLDKAIEVRERLPDLERIVLIDPRGVVVEDDPMVLTFEELERLGGEAKLEEYEQSVQSIKASDAGIMVYTSGTTGPPKGAMLTHANLLAAADAYVDAYDLGPSDEVLSYLPLCHIAERLVSLVDALRAGYLVNFGEGPDTFAADLAEAQPTFFLGVPRVWERMMATVEIRVADADPLKRLAYRYWIARGRALARRRLTGGRRIGDRLVEALGFVFLFRALREKLGMRRIRVALSGAAPIAPEVLEWLWAFGVPVREGYGQTENTAMATYTPADDVRIGRVGRALPGVELRIGDEGEILTRSAGVFPGYWNDPEATAATVDGDGWLHTGDMGELDQDGFLAITDRKKDIIITAGGKNVSPSEIENKLKVSPFVREAVVIGDRRKFLTALIGIDGEVVGDWATRRGIPYTTYADLSARPEVRELVSEAVDAANSELARVEGVKRFELLPVELDHEDGQLTATQKVKRAAIAEQFQDQIEEMYR
jgi:long-chain acyl-CoA synthetase